MDSDAPPIIGTASRARGGVKPMAPTVPRGHAPARTIAIVGCDGAGKSTLAADLLRHARQRGRARFVYLGQSSGNIKRALAALPIAGPRIARRLEARATRMHDPDAEAITAPTAAAVYLLSRWRAHKFLRVMRLARRGVTVITDRWPQAEIPGFPVDGPGLGAKPVTGRLATRLARREQRLYANMAAQLPALVIRLDVDLATAQARKPDHPREQLQRKCAVIPTLCFHGAPILALDARRPYPEVLAAAVAGMDAALTEASHDR